MQNSLTEYPWESKDKIFGYWALNDVGTALYIQGEALRKAGKELRGQTGPIRSWSTNIIMPSAGIPKGGSGSRRKPPSRLWMN